MIEHNRCDSCGAFVEDASLYPQCKESGMDAESRFKVLRMSMGLTYAPVILTYQDYLRDWVCSG